MKRFFITSDVELVKFTEITQQLVLYQCSMWALKTTVHRQNFTFAGNLNWSSSQFCSLKIFFAITVIFRF